MPRAVRGCPLFHLYGPRQQTRKKVAGLESAAELEARARSVDASEKAVSSCAALALQTSGTKCPCVSSFDAVLQRVIDAWQYLGEPIQTAILAMVHSVDNADARSG
jgi:hypothetical protein